jgi:putative transposase
MKFGFVAKHRGVWPVSWLCEALGVSRSGFHAWLSRPPSARAVADEALTARVRASFVVSDRTYGARRVWHDMLAEGARCGLHRVERLMRAQALRARPRRRGLPVDQGERFNAAIAANVLDLKLKIPSNVSTTHSDATRPSAISAPWSSSGSPPRARACPLLSESQDSGAR